AGLAVLTSWCGLTSLSTNVTAPPRARLRVCAGLNGPPFTDHEWQPRVWCRMTTVADFGAAEAIAAASATPATAATRMASVRFMVVLLSPSCSAQCRPREGVRHRATR